MVYSSEISRTSPACFLFLIDQSGSMADSWGGEPTKKKADELAIIINHLLRELCISCARAEGVRDYFFVGVLGYGNQVRPAFVGPLSGKSLVPVSEIANSPGRIEERTNRIDSGAGETVEQSIKYPIWLDPVASGGTPMCQTLDQAYLIIQEWLSQHPDCFPPIVINITDGESTDGDPRAKAMALTHLSSTDGNVLLFNVHLSSIGGEPIMFPDQEPSLPDEFARLLYSMSSVLPEGMRNQATQEEFEVSDSSRGFAFNTDIIGVVRFLEIGTRPSNLR